MHELPAERRHIFDKFLEIDEAAVREGTTVASIDKVRLVNTRFGQLAHILDQLLHYLYLNYGDVKKYGNHFEDDINKH